eukprot:51628-Amphidinium_carterae.2
MGQQFGRVRVWLVTLVAGPLRAHVGDPWYGSKVLQGQWTFWHLPGNKARMVDDYSESGCGAHL